MLANLVLAAEDVVGESLIWDANEKRLLWIDIIGRRVHGFVPTSGQHNIWPLTGRPTSIGLCADGNALLGMERHICSWDWQGEPIALVEVEPDLPANRLNEGVVDPDGCFWVGTMMNNINDDDSPRDIFEATGRLYRFRPDGVLERVSGDCFGITNTLVFPAADRLVTADTLANTLYSYHIGLDGKLSERQTLLSGFQRGLPDGSCLDSQGRIWTARVAGGGCLTCVNQAGKIEEVIDLPCSWPTSCAFGGTDLTTLYVSSARFTQSIDHLAVNPQEGGLFALELGIQGRPTNLFGMFP